MTGASGITTNQRPARRLLIVDDDRDALYSFQRIFQRDLLGVMVAENGEDALEQLERTSFDCVLMDIRMPGLDGLDTLRLVRKRHPLVPVILMSAFADSGSRHEAASAGTFEFIRKPVDIPLLRQMVNDGISAGELNRAMPSDWPSSFPGLIPGTSPAAQSIRSALEAWFERIRQSLQGLTLRTPGILRIQGKPGSGRRLLALGVHRLLMGANRIPHLIQLPNTNPDDALASPNTPTAIRFGAPDPVIIVTGQDGGLSKGTGAMLSKVFRDICHCNGARVFITIENHASAEPLPDDQTGVDSLTIHLPDISDRREDLPELSQLLATAILADIGRRVEGPPLTDRFARRLSGLRWPGQLPQLRNTLRELLNHAEELPLASAPGFEPTGDEIAELHDEGVSRPNDSSAVGEPLPIPIMDRLFEEICRVQPLPPGMDLFDVVERHLIRRSLELFNGNQSRAARLLGITRNTLRKRVAKYGFKASGDRDYSSSSGSSSSS
jgi:DNA-binding NtrC family response regulator